LFKKFGYGFLDNDLLANRQVYFAYFCLTCFYKTGVFLANSLEARLISSCDSLVRFLRIVWNSDV
jgi:hypothetical protein